MNPTRFDFPASSHSRPHGHSTRWRVTACLAAFSWLSVSLVSGAETVPSSGAAGFGGGGGAIQTSATGAPTEVRIEQQVQAGAERARREISRAGSEMAKAVETLRRQAGQTQIGFHGGASLRTLIVPRPETSEEQVAEIQEQLAIMSRIVTKAVDPQASGPGFRFRIVGFGLSSGTDLDALYLDGYGATFLASVEYPLLEPAKTPDKKGVATADKDTTWEKTRRELAGISAEEEPADDGWESDNNSGPGFDAERVAALRKRLIESFRHAANLKCLREGADRVTLIVSGWAPKPAKTKTVGGMRLTSRTTQYIHMGGAVQLLDGGSGHRPQQLTLTARKGDVDAFAAGRLTFEEFSRKVSSTTQGRSPAGD